MPYTVGIDIDSSRVVAAISRLGGSGHGPVETMSLGAGEGPMPNVLYLDGDGYLIMGEAARHAGAADPDRVATGFHDRIGDDVPVILAGETFTPQSLSAAVIAWSVAHVAELLGEPAESVTVTCPGHWGRFRQDLLGAALRGEGLADVHLLPAPVAVMGAHTRAGATVVPDAVAAVFDVRGHRITPSLLRRSVGGTWNLLAAGGGADAPCGAADDPARGVTSVIEDALAEARSLARDAEVDLRRLDAVALHGSPKAIPAAGDLLRAALACRPIALPDPDATAARGALAVPDHRRGEDVASVETALLPSVGAVDVPAEAVPSRPVRPPVRIDAPRIVAAKTAPVRASHRPNRVAATLVALTTLATMLMLRGDLGTAGAQQHDPPAAPAAQCGPEKHQATGC